MANVKMEVFPEMANPGNCRNRILETPEKPLICPEENCTQPGTCRAIRNHWNSEHSVGKQVLSVKCAQDQCMWFCFHDTLKCFVFHMRSIHDINTTSDSEILFTVKIPKNNATHSQHCNASASEANAKRKEKQGTCRIQISQENREKKLALLQAKKAAPEIPANNVITPAKVVMETQSINITVTSNVNIQVAGSTSQKSTQTARIEQVLDGFRAKPFVDGKHMTYTSEEF